jgi:hypothetical protein
MADNVTANPGTGGATFASDDIGGIQYPRVKVTLGADGANDGDVSATNPMPTRASNGTTFLTAKALNVAPVDTDIAQVVQSILHGRSTAGGGTFVDVKVNPSGALVADVSDSQLPLPTGAASEATLASALSQLVTISGGSGAAENLLRQLVQAATSPAGFDRSLGRGRVTAIVESGTVTTVSTVTTVTTVTTVSGLTNIDGRNGAMLINQTNLSAWADCVRARIT